MRQQGTRQGCRIRRRGVGPPRSWRGSTVRHRERGTELEAPWAMVRGFRLCYKCRRERAAGLNKPVMYLQRSDYLQIRGSKSVRASPVRRLLWASGGAVTVSSTVPASVPQEQQYSRAPLSSPRWQF